MVGAEVRAASEVLPVLVVTHGSTCRPDSEEKARHSAATSTGCTLHPETSVRCSS